MERSSARSVRGQPIASRPLVLVSGLIVLLGMAAAVTGSVATPAGAQPGDSEEFFDFEDVPARISGTGATAPVRGAYADRGLVFPNGVTALVFDDTSFPPRPDLPRSPSQVITTCYSAEFCSSQITMAFDPPLERLDLHVGYARDLADPAGVILEIFDGNGASIGATRLTLGPSDTAIPATNLLTITDQAGRIERAQVRLADEDRFLGSLIADDLTITPFAAVAEATLEPDPIEFDLTDETLTTEVELVNTGNQPLGQLSIEIIEDGDPAADIEATLGSGCAPELAPGEGCTITIEATPSEPGTFDGALAVLDGSGEVAVVSLQARVAQPPDDTTDSTAGPDDTEPPSTPSTPSTAAGEGTGTTASTDDGETPAEENEPSGFPDWLVYVVGGVILGIGGRKVIKGRRPPPSPEPVSPDPAVTPEPPAPETQPPGGPPPEVVIRPDIARPSIEVDGDRALVARTGLGTAVITISDDQTSDQNDDQDEGSGP